MLLASSLSITFQAIGTAGGARLSLFLDVRSAVRLSIVTPAMQCFHARGEGGAIALVLNVTLLPTIPIADQADRQWKAALQQSDKP